MSFLAPLFLMGALALSLPVLFHLARRVTRERTVFSSLMFLKPSAPRLTRRSRVEHWLLLILRCLALALLVLGFSRPFLTDKTSLLPLARAPRHVVLLLDTSASMRREGLWDAAKARADAVIKSLAPTDHLAVLTFGRTPVTALSFAEWESHSPDARVSLASERVTALRPSWEGTHLGRALIAASDAFTDLDREATTTGPREIILISDLQAGSRLDTLQAYEWPKGVALKVESVTARTRGNAGVQVVAEASSDKQTNEGVRIRVTNSEDATAEQLVLRWKRGASEEVGEPIPVHVPAGQSRIVRMELPANGAGIDRIELQGDAEPFDNTVYVAPVLSQSVPLMYLGSENADAPAQPLYFLRRALEAIPRVRADIRFQRADSEVGEAVLADNALLVATEAPGPNSLQQVRRAVERGQTLLAVPKNAEAMVALAQLVKADAVAVEERKPSSGGSYAMWGEIDFRHPLFLAFADPRFSDFTKIHVWQYRRIQAEALPASRVIARYDSGDPAVIETTLGAGRILWLTSGWHAEDSQLAVSSKFVPLLWSILDYAGILRAETSSYAVGEALPLERSTDVTEVFLPSGSVERIATGATSTAPTFEPGLHRVVQTRGETRFTVNLDASESRTEPLSQDELEQRGVPIAGDLASDDPETARNTLASAQAVETEARQKLWRWFLVATLAILLMETLLAGWTATKKGAVVP
ncbi:MAG TPA: BatA domain-containing protein [Opitutaceae bacterium]|nr:BatA domain-containing protein [Opitutaceae bacterium]